MDRDIYTFDKGDRLENRNTYFYVPYHGKEFIYQWRASREDALSQYDMLCSSFDFDEVVSLGKPPYKTELLLNYLHYSLLESGYENHNALSNIDKLLQRFEVTKRIYTEYDQDYRACNRDNYKEISLYLMFGELLVRVLDNTKKLTYLNALLKLLDSLLSIKQMLSEGEIRHLAWLCKQERKHIESVIDAVEVEL